MDEQERKMLEEVLALSRDNNVALGKLVKSHRQAMVWRAIYWSIIILSTLVAYFSVQPYLTSLIGIYSGQDINRVLDNLSAPK